MSGGAKIWECSKDLVQLLLNSAELHTGPAIDVGCGHGLPGISALNQGFMPVVFIDFNEEVFGTLYVLTSTLILI